MQRPLCYDTQMQFPVGGGWLTPTELIVQFLFIFGFAGLVVWIMFAPFIAPLLAMLLERYG